MTNRIGQKDYNTEDIKHEAINILRAGIDYIEHFETTYIPKPDSNMGEAIMLVKNTFNNFMPNYFSPIFIYDKLLQELEEYRELIQHEQPCYPDHTIRVCEAKIAAMAGYKDRNAWKHLQKIN